MQAELKIIGKKDFKNYPRLFSAFPFTPLVRYKSFNNSDDSLSIPVLLPREIQKKTA